MYLQQAVRNRNYDEFIAKYMEAVGNFVEYNVEDIDKCYDPLYSFLPAGDVLAISKKR